jgi:hypothetical protein
MTLTENDGVPGLPPFADALGPLKTEMNMKINNC